MIDLAKKRRRLLTIINKYKTLYQYSTKEEQLLISSSLSNFIWNSWSTFWRNYWIVYIRGGIDLSKQKVTGLHPELNISQACAFANQYKNSYNRSKYRYADTICPYNEPNWGDSSLITNIASEFLNIQSMGYLVSLIAEYKNELDDFQKIRNSFIHINNNSINQLQLLKPHYIFTSRQPIIDILNAKRFGTTKICFYSVLDSMSGLLGNLNQNQTQ